MIRRTDSQVLCRKAPSGAVSTQSRDEIIRGRQIVAVGGSVLCEWSIFVRVEGVWLVRAPEVDLC